MVKAGEVKGSTYCAFNIFCQHSKTTFCHMIAMSKATIIHVHACQTIMHNLQLFSLQDSLKPTRVKILVMHWTVEAVENFKNRFGAAASCQQRKGFEQIKPLSFKSFNLFVQKWFPELSDKKNEQVIREVSLRTMSFENVMMIVERKKKHSW